jgi:hypothetical protein
MSLLSKSEIQFLQGKKQISKSYEYKLKSIIKRKISTLLEKVLPLLSKLFPNLSNLTKNSKEEGLSSRRSRVQIPAGASVISEKYSNINTRNSIYKFPNFLPDFEKSLLNAKGNCLKYNGNEPEADQKTTLPNSVRLPPSSLSSTPSDPPSEKDELWNDFRKYLINEGQRKHRDRNSMGYAKKFYHILEMGNA